MGGVGYVAQSLCFFSALKYASAGLVALLLYLYPFLVSVLGVVFLRERLTALRAGALVAAMRATSVDAAAAEYDALFQGVGKPEVFLYGSFYLSGFLNERPLAALRDELAALGLARDETRGETEDHIAAVCEVMRYLIAGDDVAVCNLEQQRRFFRGHLQPWVEALCDAAAAQPRAQLYRVLADFTRAFVQVETQAFDMVE